MAKKQPDPPVEVIEEEPVEEVVEDAPDPALAEFAEGWFARHADEGVSDVGFQPATCDCGADHCTGYQMVHPHDHSHHYH